MQLTLVVILLALTNAIPVNTVPNVEYSTKSNFGGIYWSNYTDSWGWSRVDIEANNSYTNAWKCPAGSNQLCVDYVLSDCTYAVSGMIIYDWTYNFCVCNGPVNEYTFGAFGGIYDAVSPNPITNDFICPQGMDIYNLTEFSLCMGSNSSNITSYAYGGMYAYIKDIICQPNVYTSTCSCPDYAPKTFNFNRVVGGFTNINVTICMGDPITVTTPPPTVPVITPTIKPSHKSSDNTEIIVICVIFSVVVLSIFGVVTYFAKRNSYQPIRDALIKDDYKL